MKRFKSIFLIALRYYRHLGLRVCLYALLSLCIALASPLVVPFLGGQGYLDRIDFSAVMPVLTILATSMLAVSTFSLNVMVSAHRAAANATTPRMHRLLLDDTTTQSVLATFIGAFVFSLVTIVLYQAGFYAENAAVIVMAVSVFVVGLVIVSMLRWIPHLTNLGSVDNSLALVTHRAKVALAALARDPAFGAHPLTDDIRPPASVISLKAPASGYLQIVDVPGLQSLLPDQSSIHLRCRPGVHVLRGQVIAQVSGTVDADVLTKLAAAFVLGEHRTFEQDAEFGLIVLSEIACKALSPGVNDPGTAIEAITCLKTLLWQFANLQTVAKSLSATRVYMPVPDCDGLCRAAFAPIARDGAGAIEVVVCLGEALRGLADVQNAEMARAACRMLDDVIARNEAADLQPYEADQLAQLARPA
ncbi:DUF2254 domain-containing protein [Roseobacter sp.]|uniref:DUF2254 domain-containing protein n=1 Tax=Roseobacter sp. TaxID=1907202 RepID=UPI0032992589